MEGIYSSAKVCENPSSCLDLEPGLETILAHNRSYDRLLWAWQGWHDTVGPRIRPLYTEFLALSNQGARDWGFADTGDLWRQGYDMAPKDFSELIESVWKEILPLYEQLHCYVRAKLSAFYGADKVPLNKPLPAHLLGDMWAQDWSNIYDLVVPFPSEPNLDVTPQMVAKGWTPEKMHNVSEAFYMSLGLDPLPPSYRKKSMIERPPAPRQVVCHASAWDFGNDDLRIKMCTKITHEDLLVIHHEQGHLYYDHYYRQQPYLFRGGANDGFHEAIGDTIALSASTPSYLNYLDLFPVSSLTESGLINFQLKMALAKLAFLPFGYLVDQWRWSVFSGETPTDQMNAHWWRLRQKYQGVAAPMPRSEEYFDPGAKYHVAANVPYMRYFLAHILQFQFHEALCQASGSSQPLYQCNIFNSTSAGARLQTMLSLGASQPWQQALYRISSQTTLNASSFLAYFAPLRAFLAKENAGRQCGWPAPEPAPSPSPPPPREGLSVGVIVLVAVLGVLVVGFSSYCAYRKCAGSSFLPVPSYQPYPSELIDSEWNELMPVYNDTSAASLSGADHHPRTNMQQYAI